MERCCGQDVATSGRTDAVPSKEGSSGNFLGEGIRDWRDAFWRGPKNRPLQFATGGNWSHVRSCHPCGKERDRAHDEQ